MWFSAGKSQSAELCFYQELIAVDHRHASPMARTLFDIYPAPTETSSADKNPLLAAAKKMKGSTSRGQYRVVKRCLYFVAFVSLLPVGVIYLVSSDQLYKLRNYSLVSV